MGTDDMKPFINIKRPDDDVDMLKIEKKEINDEDYNYPHFVKLGSTDDFFKTGPKHKEIQSIIDSQLQNFESFKIQKFVDVEAPEKDPESELDKLRRHALKVIE